MIRKNLLSVFVLAAVLLGGGALPASAQTISTQSPSSFCAFLTSNLSRGHRDTTTNNQVSALQQFLASQGYTQSVTGYFGNLTWGNLMRFQHSHGIFASGYFGPLTRAAVVHLCGGGSTVGNLSVTNPVQGQIVQNGSALPISWNYNATSTASTSMKIELYTASGTSVGLIAVRNNATDTSGTYSWSVPPYPNNRLCMMIYPNGLCGASLSGQYYIKVSAVSGMGFDPNATVYASGNSGIFTITSTSTQSSFVMPTSGTAPLTVTFNPENYTGTYAINFGDGSSASMITGTTTHTYANRGTYTATLTSDLGCMHTTPRCMIATMLLGSVTINAY